MRFAIGYQLPDEDDSIPSIARDYPEAVAEVYFALPGEPSGRAPLACGDGWSVPEARETMLAELAELAAAGVRLTMLFNSACYGSQAASDELRKRVITSVEDVPDLFGVTTTSPFIAEVIKQEFPHLRVIASVNMRVETTRMMEQLAYAFDGFYLRRERNRDLPCIEHLHDWCRQHGKELLLLANSGCLRDCAFQSFHDNMVGHEHGNTASKSRWPAPCWCYLEHCDAKTSLLKNSWIRPEDLQHYERWFGVVKLATRMHANPRRVLGAYARGHYRGNLLDLTEPGYGPLFAGQILDNARFPADWFTRSTTCRQQCEGCDYCSSVAGEVWKAVD